MVLKGCKEIPTMLLFGNATQFINYNNVELTYKLAVIYYPKCDNCESTEYLRHKRGIQT